MHTHTTYDNVIHVDQPKPPKRATSIRLAGTGRDRITTRAHQADVTFSAMVRRMLAYADRYMPEGWTPAMRAPMTSNDGKG